MSLLKITKQHEEKEIKNCSLYYAQLMGANHMSAFIGLFIFSSIASSSSAQGVLVIDAVKFLRPYDFDVLLNDINENDLHLIAQMDGISYLNTSNLTPEFPVEGMIMGPHNRLMINLLTRKRKTSEYRNVIYMVDTGSPYTFLSKSAIEIISGSTENIPAALKIEIQGSQSIVGYMSPPNRHFADINLLGMDFLQMKSAQIVTDWAQKTFKIYDSGTKFQCDKMIQ